VLFISRFTTKIAHNPPIMLQRAEMSEGNYILLWTELGVRRPKRGASEGVTANGRATRVRDRNPSLQGVARRERSREKHRKKQSSRVLTASRNRSTPASQLRNRGSRKPGTMGFTSFVGRVAFSAIFIMAAWQK
jgi:hypothetical protein